MKRLIIPLIVLLLMGSCTLEKKEVVQQTQNIKMMEKEEKKQIEKLLSIYKESLNNSDAKLAQSLYTKEGVFMPTEAPSAIGSENILKSYEFIFSQIQLSVEFFIEEIVVEGDLAFATTSSKGTVLIHANGMKLPESNRELFVFEKVNKEWKIARYMFNKTEAKK